MTFFSEIEKAIERMFHRSTEKLFGKAEADDLLLVHREILRNVETRVERAQRNQPLFPYNHVAVRLMSPDEHRRATYAASFVQDARLENDLRELLQRAGCELPRGFAVEIEVLDGPAAGLEIRYLTEAPAARTKSVPARICVIHGQTAESSYALTKGRTNIGRMPVVLDRDQRPLRSNDIAFEDDRGEVNATVSRSHAHIQHDPVSDEYRICDDGSEYGTRIFRDGRAIDVPSANRHGERLRAGDEIYFGRACARFELDP